MDISSVLFVVCCACSGLSDELIARSEESYRVCVFVCVLETTTMWRPRPELGVSLQEEEEEEEEKCRTYDSQKIFFA